MDNKNNRIQELIDTLDLQPNPEGGFFAEVYRAPQQISTSHGDRNLATSIYFLLTSDNISRFHRIKSDEIWFHHEGSPLTVHVLSEKGYGKLLVGPSKETGHQPQQIVPAGVIFGSTVDEVDSYSLVSCVVAPGFDFRDFELFGEPELMGMFPDQGEIIRKMSK
jgi:predicted cupin superfamily sugar epimerase